VERTAPPKEGNAQHFQAVVRQSQDYGHYTALKSNNTEWTDIAAAELRNVCSHLNVKTSPAPTAVKVRVPSAVRDPRVFLVCLLGLVKDSDLTKASVLNYPPQAGARLCLVFAVLLFNGACISASHRASAACYSTPEFAILAVSLLVRRPLPIRPLLYLLNVPATLLCPL